MAGSGGRSDDGRTVFVFGAQVLSPTKEVVGKMLESLRKGSSPGWVLDVASSLPEYWEELCKEVPEIKGSVEGSVLLGSLSRWLHEGVAEGDKIGSLPNVVLTPIVIMSQLTQYWKYLESRNVSSGEAGADYQASLVAGEKTEVLGFCVGLLSSYAVASSSNQKELEHYSSVAVRIAMLIGALTDAQEGRARGIGQGRSVAYAASWKTAAQRETMVKVIKGLSPEVYISVLWDEGRATITASKRKVPLLMKQLRDTGVTTLEVGLRARVHNPLPEMARYTDLLTKICRGTDGLKLRDAAELAMPTYDNAGGGEPVAPVAGGLHELALRAVLVDKCQWYGTFTSVMDKGGEGDDRVFVSFGPEQCVPVSRARLLEPRIESFSVLDEGEETQP